MCQYSFTYCYLGGAFDSVFNTSMRLGLARSNLQAARVGNYILFVGGSTMGNYTYDSKILFHIIVDSIIMSFIFLLFV